MGLAVLLLGDPTIERDGTLVPAPAGRKSWALLAYLALAEQPPGRRQVAELLFPDADDPLGSLRWTLSEIRRATGWTQANLGGDPLVLDLPPGDRVDAADLRRGIPGSALAATRGRLLADLAFDHLPAFDFWLQTQRQHLANLSDAMLRDEILAGLASGQIDGALDTAHQLVLTHPLDSRNQEALIRSLVAAERFNEARLHLARCSDLFARELGVPLPDTLTSIARTPVEPERDDGQVSVEAALAAQLDAGRAAIGAGATEKGIGHLRHATDLARRIRDPACSAASLVELGEASAHEARLRDTEVVTVLHRAMALAEAADRDDLGARAACALAYVQIQSGDASRGQTWLAVARDLAAGDDYLLSQIHGIVAMAHSDQAHYPQALEAFTTSIALAESGGRRRQVAWSSSMEARTHLLRGDLASALDRAELAVEIARSERWTSLLPWPQSLRGEVHRQRGDLRQAESELEHAFALGEQVGDLCWMSVASRFLAALALDRGRHDDVELWLRRSRRHSLPYVWVEAHALDGVCALTSPSDHLSIRAAASQLADLSARAGLREYSARAAAHLARAGDQHAAAAARHLARDIDNPELHDALGALDSAPPPVV
jgi:DNA-binding SARP family transcriptional activator